jgi:hypothetical protein
MAIPKITKFNEQEYEYEIYLDSTFDESETRRFPINPNAIVNLNIEETLADWVTKGTLTIFDSFDGIENTPSTPGILGAGPKYVFRNDGNDILYIRFHPKLDTLNLELNPVHWDLVYKFAIYDVEDIDKPPGAQGAASAATKCKKFYFWDHIYQKMITNTLEYSTAYNENADLNRAIPTGIAMKEVINKATQPYQFQINLQNWEDLVGGSNEQDWDEGASKIFYTAPSSNSAYDTLMDIYNRHISTAKYSHSSGVSGPRGSSWGVSDNDFCVLLRERGPNPGDEGYFCLRPMSVFFEKAGKNEPGEFQIERFYIQDYAPESNSSPGVKYSPQSQQQNLQKDTVLGQYSQISSYRFVDISPFTNSTEFCNRPVYSFDFLNRTMNINFSQNSVKTARNFITKKYLSRIRTERENNEKMFLITLDEGKENRNVKPVYSLYGDDNENGNLARQADGLQKLLKIGVFQNACISFRVLGSTNREPGRFIAIDKEYGIQDSTFNNKFFGQWFIINVRHIFEAGIYYNEITAVKLHRFKPLDVNIPKTI